MKNKYFTKCPQCGNDIDFEKVNTGSKITEVVSIFDFALAPFFRGVKRYKCPKCSAIIKKPSEPKSTISRILNVIMWLFGISIVLTILFSFRPELLNVVPENNIIILLEKFIQDHNRSTAIGIIFLFFTVLPVCVIVSLISSIKFRKKLRNEYYSNKHETNVTKSETSLN